MTPLDVLHAFVRAVNAACLYGDDHPTLARAVDAAYGALGTVTAGGSLAFAFVDDQVLCGTSRLRDPRSATAARRLARAGLERVEFGPSVTRDAFATFVRAVARATAGEPVAESTSIQGIRVGRLAIAAAAQPPTAAAETRVPLEEALEALARLHAEVENRGRLLAADARAVVSLLALARRAGATHAHAAAWHDTDAVAGHAVRVALLAMALAEALGHGMGDVRAIGIAGLLHDVGKLRLPPAVRSAATLTADEAALLRTHPAEGARLILHADDLLDLAAVVAYEHHMGVEGGGYPEPRFRRELHWATRLVRVCDVFDALRTSCAPSPGGPLQGLEARAGGGELDASFVRALAGLVGEPAAA